MTEPLGIVPSRGSAETIRPVDPPAGLCTVEVRDAGTARPRVVTARPPASTRGLLVRRELAAMGGACREDPRWARELTLQASALLRTLCFQRRMSRRRPERINRYGR
jgi:hypothetical protein